MDAARSAPQGAPYHVDVSCWCSLGIAPRAQLLKKSAWLLHLIGDEAPPAAHDSSEVARTLSIVILTTGTAGSAGV